MPLYNEAPITPEVEEEQDEAMQSVERKLIAATALSSVDALEGIVSTFELPKRKKKKMHSRRKLPKHICSKIGLPVLVFLTFGLLLAAVIALGIAQAKSCVSQPRPRPHALTALLRVRMLRVHSSATRA